MKKFIFGKFAGTNVYNVSMGASQCFDGREDSFLDGGFFFKWGVHPGGIGFDGGFSKISYGGGWRLPMPPTMGNPEGNT